MLSLKKTLALAVLATCTSVSLAQDAPPNYIGAMGSFIYPDSGSHAKYGYGGHILYGSPINNWLSLELNGFGQELTADSGYTGKASAFGAGLDVRGMLYKAPYFGIDLFALGGIGATYRDLAVSGEKGVAPYLDAGAGLLMPLAHNFNLRAEARYYALISSQVSSGKNITNEGRANVGVEFNFGDVAQAAVMAPPPPEEVHMVDPDSDGDGVLDSADTCPNTPPGTSVDEKGCALPAAPVPVAAAAVSADADNDGVADSADKCPGTAPGLKVDADGCVVQQTLVLHNIVFATNSGALTEDSKRVLDKIAEGMLGQPTMTIEIDGHTDNVGAQDYNLTLSQARAKLVRLYLKSKGVQFERMSVDGFGQFKPIADNKTEEGRALNRRVEFKITRQ